MVTEISFYLTLFLLFNAKAHRKQTKKGERERERRKSMRDATGLMYSSNAGLTVFSYCSNTCSTLRFRCVMSRRTNNSKKKKKSPCSASLSCSLLCHHGAQLLLANLVSASVSTKIFKSIISRHSPSYRAMIPSTTTTSTFSITCSSPAFRAFVQKS